MPPLKVTSTFYDFSLLNHMCIPNESITLMIIYNLYLREFNYYFTTVRI